MKLPLRYDTRRQSVKAIQYRGNNEAACAELAGRDFKCPLDGYLVKFDNGDVVAMPETAFLHIFQIES